MSGRIALRHYASEYLLLALLACLSFESALAQGAAATCAPTVGRLVSVQGNVDVQRAGTHDWIRINRLDTSVCTGDRVRTAPLSRAALFVQPETLVRVDQNTTIALSQTTAEIVVEFFQDDVIRAARDAQSCGAGYFITRFPKKLRVTTPHMNAAVEGTEFEVDVRCASTELAVIEGTVRSRNVGTGEERMVTGGEMLIAGPSSPAVFTTLVKPTDAVEWTLYYPPLSDSGSEIDVPSVEQCRGQAAPAGQACLTRRAETLLRAAQSDEALRDINEVLATDAGNGEALALRAVIEIARNNNSAALESAKAASAASPESYRSWLALSYAQQASFQLEPALASAQRAQQLQPSSSVINARVAELLMSLGRIDEAETSARTNVAADPSESRAHAVLGFVHLARIDTREAHAAFAQAIDLDSFDPLPRLGLGLATIREGDLAAGREQLEIALALDPGNSLLRSYLGKAYYEEKRDKLSAEQLAMAKSADPRDPTPWLYDALRLQSINRPVDAVHEMQHSVDLNDNRAIFRSRLLLDEDLAARGAGLGGIYRNLGFEQLALIEGYQAVSADPGSQSGHRLLADHYDSLPRHEIARVNELFRSQLLQPLNTTPIPVQLGQASLFLNSANGTTDVSFNEFTQLFDRDQLRIRAAALGGEEDTRGDDVTISGISNRFSFNLGQYLFETDGFRDNNDSKQEVYSALAQFAISHDTSVLAELRSTESDQGDLALLFNPDVFDPALRQTEDTHSTRLGLRHDFTPRSQILASLLYQDADITTGTEGFDSVDEFQGYTAELQHIYRGVRWNLTSGIRYFDLEQDETQTFPVLLPDPPFIDFVTLSQSFAFEDLTAYVYSDFDLGAHWRVTLGASATASEGRSFDEDQINPKVGLVWQPLDGTTVRAAAVRTLQPSTFSESNIQPYLEPTEVAGFNQFFSGVAGEDVTRYGVAIDQEFSRNVRAGLEASERDIETSVTITGPPDQSFAFDTSEKSGRAYVFWTPAGVRNVALRAEYQYDEQDMEEFPEFGATRLETWRVPLGISYFSSAGLSVDLLGTYVDQEGEFLEFLPDPPFVNAFTDDDQFWVVDASLSYRLPKRYGLVTLSARNLLDEEFNFQDVDPRNPTILPERMLLLRVTVDFSIQ